MASSANSSPATRVLVYGAGTLGCLLAHKLAHVPGLELALLARGSWADALEQRGLTVHHYGRRRTTVDRIPIARELAPSDVYGLAFVVMQAQQLPAVLPVLAKSACRRVVFVGNNPDAAGIESQLSALAQKEGAPKKEVAFAFQATGGKRDIDHAGITAVYSRLSITLGGATRPLSPGFSSELNQVLPAAGFKVSREDCMDAWLKCHLAFVLPMAFISYARGCNLRRAERKDFALALDACNEAFQMLKAHDIPILPEGDEEEARPSWRRSLMEAAFWLLAKTRLGDLAVTDHCRHATAEMRYLADGFGRFLTPDIGRDMPTWHILRARMPPWDELP